MTDKHQPEPIIALMVFKTPDNEQLQINMNIHPKAPETDYLQAVKLISDTLKELLSGPVDKQKGH